MEKVENLYRTATSAEDLANTSEQIRSRLRDSRAPMVDVCAVQHRAPQDESVKRQHHEQAERNAGAPAIARDSSGTIQAAASRLISKSRKPRLSPWRTKNAIATASTTRS